MELILCNVHLLMASPLSTLFVQLHHPTFARLLGATLCHHGRVKDTVLLYGDVGVGKSEIARGYVQHALKDRQLAVSSPTFMIENQYACMKNNKAALIHHIDMYRLTETDEIPVNLNDGLQLRSARVKNITPLLGINIIEWAERLGERKETLFPNRVEVLVTIKKEAASEITQGEISDDEFDFVGHHQAKISFYGDWKDRIFDTAESLRKVNEATMYEERTKIEASIINE